MIQQTIQDVFKRSVLEEGIFKNKKVLSIDYTPDNIPHREELVVQLSKILAPALKGEKPSNVFIYGPTGTGKTLITRFVLKELERTAGEMGTKVKTLYVNSNMKRVADTEYRLFAHLAKLLGEEVPFTGLPTDVVYERFFKSIEKQGGVFVIAIDEIDVLVDKIGDRFLYTLTRMNQELKNSFLSVVGISNNLSFTEALDARVQSSLSEEEILFPPYNAIQLRDILMDRAKEAFNEGKVKEGVINKCAALAAQEHGDARKALDLLRVAGEIAEREQASVVEERHVEQAEVKIDYDRMLEAVKAQPKHSKLITYVIIDLLINKEREKVLTGDVYDAYISLCNKNKIKTITQRRVSDIIGELDLLGVVNAKVISHGRYGRTREISLANSKETYKKIYSFIKTDQMLE